MRISDWSSDVCSSDLGVRHRHSTPGVRAYLKTTSAAAKPIAAKYGSLICCPPRQSGNMPPVVGAWAASTLGAARPHAMQKVARKSVGEGKRGSVRGDLGGGVNNKKKK